MTVESVPLGAPGGGAAELALVPKPGTLKRVVGYVQAVVYFGLLGLGVFLPIVLLAIGFIRG